MINGDSKKEWVQKGHARQQPIAKNAPFRQREDPRAQQELGGSWAPLGASQDPSPGCQPQAVPTPDALGRLGWEAVKQLQISS